jgi:hypothetical protein
MLHSPLQLPILKQRLDYDKISPESFQSFTFPWEVVIGTVKCFWPLNDPPHLQPRVTVSTLIKQQPVP